MAAQVPKTIRNGNLQLVVAMSQSSIPPIGAVVRHPTSLDIAMSISLLLVQRPNSILQLDCSRFASQRREINLKSVEHSCSE